MKTEASSVLLFLIACCVVSVTGTTLKENYKLSKSVKDDIMDVSDFSVYYDLETNATIRKMMPRPWYRPGWKLRLPFKGGRCRCEVFKCTCCTGVKINTFNFDKRTCAILTYESTESMIGMEVTMNNNSIYRNTFSARNPPPFCVPIPVPYLPPGLIDMCIRLFDISVVGPGLHVCMDMDTRIDKAPVLVLHFDCMNMGYGGVSLTKPGGSGNQTNVISPTPEPTQVNGDVYDPVTEDREPSTIFVSNNTVKYI